MLPRREPEQLNTTRKSFRNALACAGLALFFLPLPNPVIGFISLHAQSFPGRLRRPPVTSADMPPAPTPATPPASSSSNAVAPPAPLQQSVASPALPPSMLNQPAKPAEIHLTAATLSIRADNSSLSEILHVISTQSGMKLEGLGSDERVFGSFGPGKPSAVLSDLLNGTPYNVLMVGDLSDGAPRRLILTPTAQSGSSASENPSSPANPSKDADAGNGSPPNPNPQAIRTPQQMYQELQDMRAREQQQSQPE